MKVGERGQITIPKEFRDRFGIGPEAEIEFRVVRGTIILRKKDRKLNLKKWRGGVKDNFAELGYRSGVAI